MMSKTAVTIQQRLTNVVMLTSVAVLTITSLLYFTYEYYNFVNKSIERLENFANMMAANASPSLAFDDKLDAQEILNTLSFDKNIVKACLYDKQGKLFANYPEPLARELYPASRPGPEVRFENNHLEIFQPVTQGNSPLGMLYLQSNMKMLYDRLGLYALFVVFIVIISFILARILSLRLKSIILRPVLSLVNVSGDISLNHNYAVRATKYEEDELGLLTDAYNSMLDTIQQQNEKINSFNQALEDKVKKRTRELELTNNHLREQKEFVETIINSSVHSIAVFNSRLEYVVVNTQVENMYQLNKSHFLNRHILAVFPMLANTALYNDLVEAAGGKRVRRPNYKSKVIDRYFDNHFIPLTDNNEKVTGVLLIGHDITDIVEANDKLLNVNAALVKSNLELEQFAYVASHDLQEPLRKIQVFSQLAEGQLSDNSAAQLYLQKIHHSANSMRDLITSVLQYSRLSNYTEEFSEVDLNGVIREITTTLELSITEKKAQVQTGPLPMVLGIPFQLRQLFVNLLSNSLKFCTANPIIQISSHTISGRDLSHFMGLDIAGISSKLNTLGTYAVLVVKDNGIGFEEKYTSQVFSIFKRLHTKQEYPGTGIGLALVKKIVENHQGFITVKSKPGEGAIFTIYLPLKMKTND